ncbi:MAG: SDR family oxidoreductase [Opitutaceae bacterium]|nr:SDR family oxidoreductase [Opitutaceae bacterium]
MSNETVVITGACGDIGRSLASQFAATGARLGLCDLVDAETAKPVVAELERTGATVRYRRVDVTDQPAMQAFVAEIAREFGGLDICIANAGIVERGDLIDLSLEAWRRTMEVNLTGCFITAQAAARAMMSSGRQGHIVFLSSWVQDLPRENISAYCASKGGLKMLAKCLALELGPCGIRVNLVAPGWVDAGLTTKSLRINPERRPGIERQIPLGRLQSADELARTVRLLCSPDAGYITGATLLVDGGASLCFRGPPRASGA